MQTMKTQTPNPPPPRLIREGEQPRPPNPPPPPKTRKLSNNKVEINTLELFLNIVKILSFFIGIGTTINLIWFPIKSHTPFKVLGTCVVLFYSSRYILRNKRKKEIENKKQSKSNPKQRLFDAMKQAELQKESKTIQNETT